MARGAWSQEGGAHRTLKKGLGWGPPGSEPPWPFQDADLLSPGILVNAAHGSGGGGGGGGSSLESSRHLSRSNIDIPRSNGTEDPRRQLPRKRSDSSTYELDTIQQHQAFLSRYGLGFSLGGGRPGTEKPGRSDMCGGVGEFLFGTLPGWLTGAVVLYTTRAALSHWKQWVLRMGVRRSRAA